ncbi:unnamed protein product, partial [Polarella glacialis]
MATTEKLEALRRSCTGQATPLGPRKKRQRVDEAPLVDGAVVVEAREPDSLHVEKQEEFAELAAHAGRPRPPKPGGPMWRPPHWGLVKLKRLQAWQGLRKAARAFAWSDDVTAGWHSRNMRFWGEEAATVEGMTGGGVSDQDLAFNKPVLAFLASHRAVGGRFRRALDVGAGIGRVAKHLLLARCDAVDLLEPVPKHLALAKEDLHEKSWPGRFFCVSLQEFSSSKCQTPYDLVWCQWVLMYITDTDAVAFLRRAAAALLAPGGTIVVKENVSATRTGSYFDDETGELWRGGGEEGKKQKPGPMSVLRTAKHYTSLFRQAG